MRNGTPGHATALPSRGTRARVTNRNRDAGRLRRTIRLSGRVRPSSTAPRAQFRNAYLCTHRAGPFAVQRRLLSPDDGTMAFRWERRALRPRYSSIEFVRRPLTSERDLCLVSSRLVRQTRSIDRSRPSDRDALANDSRDHLIGSFRFRSACDIHIIFQIILCVYFAPPFWVFVHFRSKAPPKVRVTCVFNTA